MTLYGAEDNDLPTKSLEARSVTAPTALDLIGGHRSAERLTVHLNRAVTAWERTALGTRSDVQIGPDEATLLVGPERLYQRDDSGRLRADPVSALRVLVRDIEAKGLELWTARDRRQGELQSMADGLTNGLK